MPLREKAAQILAISKACRAGSQRGRWGMESAHSVRYGPPVRREGSRCAPMKGATPALPPQL